MSARKAIFPCYFIVILGLLHTPVSLGSTSQDDVVTRAVNNGQLLLHGVPEIPDRLVMRLQQYQNVRSASFLDWTPDGKGMYILTRFGELDQIHRVDHAGGSPHQLTFLEDPVGEVARQQGSSRLAFTMDQGGSEFSQIFLVDMQSAAIHMISDGSSRNARLVWDKGRSRLAFQSTRRNGRSNDIWLIDVNQPESARPIVEGGDDGWWAPVDFSDDGRFLLVQQLMGATDSRISLLNIANGELLLLAGGQTVPSANRAIGLDRKNEGFYMISNARGFGAELVWHALEPETTPRFITSSIPWDVAEFALSPDGRRGAFTTNENGISRLYLLNTRTGSFSQVDKLPVGLIHSLRFHPDNRQLAMTLNTAQTPSDVFVLRLGRGAEQVRSLQRWTFSEVGGLDTRDFVEPELVWYPTFDQQGELPRTIPAFYYRPPGDGPFPVIIYVHGGPESQYRPTFSSTFQMWLKELGIAVIAPNVRGSLGYGNDYLALDDVYQREDAVKDIGALLDWIGGRTELNPERVAMYGGSYGGYMVLASAVHYSQRLRAAIDVVGISNFVTFLENTQDYRRDLRRLEYGDERDEKTRAFLEGISPLNQVDKISVPLLVVQGQNDPRVPVTESEQIVDALRQRGQPVWYINALNEGHGYQRKDNQDIFQQAAMLFLQEYLVN